MNEPEVTTGDGNSNDEHVSSEQLKSGKKNGGIETVQVIGTSAGSGRATEKVVLIHPAPANANHKRQH